MRHPFLALLALLVLYPPIPAHGQDQPVNRYRVRIDDAASTAQVTASLVLRSRTLALYNVVPVPGLPNGQADLITGLEVRDEAGAVVPHRDLGGGDFEIESDGRIAVSYTVRLEHDRYAWPFGKEEVAYRTPEGLMTTGYTLFLADTADEVSGPYEVSFELPAGWQAHTPWARAGEGATFRVPTRRALLANALFLGSAYSETIETDGVALTLVLGAPYVEDLPLFADLLRGQLEAYGALFEGPPRTDRFLIIINQDPASDGGAYASSFSQLIDGDATPANRMIWGVTMAHELLHFWNGLSLVPADGREEWFKEGVTDYLTTVTLARNGVLDRELLFKRIEALPRRVLFARYGQGLTMPVRAAGADKQANRQLIYGGGAVAALALDVELRLRTDDRVGLPELMRALYATHGPAGAAPYTLDDIERTAEALSGTDFSAFFERTVEGEGIFDLRPTLQALGLRLDQFFDEVYVSFDPEATPAQQARFEAVFGTPVE